MFILETIKLLALSFNKIISEWRKIYKLLNYLFYKLLNYVPLRQRTIYEIYSQAEKLRGERLEIGLEIPSRQHLVP